MPVADYKRYLAPDTPSRINLLYPLNKTYPTEIYDQPNFLFSWIYVEWYPLDCLLLHNRPKTCNCKPPMWNKADFLTRVNFVQYRHFFRKVAKTAKPGKVRWAWADGSVGWVTEQIGIFPIFWCFLQMEKMPLPVFFPPNVRYCDWRRGGGWGIKKKMGRGIGDKNLHILFFFKLKTH